MYGRFGEKATLALKHLAQLPEIAAGRTWDGNVQTLEAFVGIKRTAAMPRLQELTGLDPSAATRMLWETYHPQLYVWIPFAAVGVISAIALGIFGQMAKRWADMNA